MCVVALFLAACGSGEPEVGVSRPLDLAFFGEERASSDATDPIYLTYDDLGPLSPGTYRSSLFRPPTTFTVGDGWHLRQHHAALITLTRSAGGEHVGPALKLINLQTGHVAVDPADGLLLEDPETMAPVPDDLSSWLTALPYLDAGAAESMETHGVEGVTFTFAVGDLQPRPLCLTDAGCVNALSYDDDRIGTGFAEGDVGRVWLFDTEPGPVYARAFGPNEPGVEDFVAGATEVVESVRLG